jgi:hypothetical protein
MTIILLYKDELAAPAQLTELFFFRNMYLEVSLASSFSVEKVLTT